MIIYMANVKMKSYLCKKPDNYLFAERIIQKIQYFLVIEEMLIKISMSLFLWKKQVNQKYAKSSLKKFRILLYKCVRIR